MSEMIRPEVRALFERWGQVLVGLGLFGLGVWLLPHYSYLLAGLGALLTLFGAAMALDGWRRNRLRAAGEGPGVVQIVEGQIGFFGPEGGGFLALDDLIELWLSADGREWRLHSESGERLAIPRAARAAEVLPDEFARLPGLSTARLVKAVEAAPTERDVRIWARHPDRINPALRALT